MLIDMDGLHMQPKEVATYQRQDLGVLKENLLNSIEECMLGDRTLPRLPQVV